MTLRCTWGIKETCWLLSPGLELAPAGSQDRTEHPGTYIHLLGPCPVTRRDPQHGSTHRARQRVSKPGPCLQDKYTIEREVKVLG